jgi:hypothetical protein
MKFEIWGSEGSYAMTSVPSTNRWLEMRERKARLLLRFEGSLKKAKQVYERFLFGGNPDRFIPLNEPAKKFLLPVYPCGFVAGDRVIFRKKYCLRSDGRFCKEFPKGLKAKVLKGDVDLPEIVWLKLLEQENPYGNDMWMSQEDACEFLERPESISKVKRRRKKLSK